MVNDRAWGPPPADEPRLPLRGPFIRWPRTADAVLAGVVFFIEVIAIQSAQRAETIKSVQGADAAADLVLQLAPNLPIFAYVILAIGSAALLKRRQYPVPVLATSIAALLLFVGLGYQESPLLASVVSLYGVGRYVSEDRKSYAGLGAALGTVVIVSLVEGEAVAGSVFSLIAAVLPWYVGRRIRIRGEFVAVLEERAAYQERERLAERREAVAEERARIARELHDVVAHRVSMMTVQAGAAKTVAADDPEGAYRAMDAVEREGRQALGELRHLLGVLRPGPAAERLGPPVGLADVPRLVAELGETGMDISLSSNGVPVDLPAHVDLSAYRIVQEALTNVLKHSGPQTHVDIRLGGHDEMLVVEVADDGNGAAGLQESLPGSGHGLLGMQERAQLLGGTLEAGPASSGGFCVMARLPLAEEQL